MAQLILPARRVTGYVVNPETGEPRNYRLNGVLVFVIAVIVWATEITGMPRDWFYRSAIYSVARRDRLLPHLFTLGGVQPAEG